jgi:phospholipase C
MRLALLMLAGCGLSRAEAEHLRLSCAFKAGALPAKTIAADERLGKDIPIEHIILVMQENRSFDHYFSELTHGEVHTAPAGVVNDDPQGKPIARVHAPALCTPDPPHDWDSVHAQWDNGAMDGFARAAPDGRSLIYYGAADIPYYYALARTFAISDMHFASLLGSTFPNRMYFMAATSFGLTGNVLPPPFDPNNVPYPNLLREMNQAQVNWLVYADSISEIAIFTDTYAANEEHFLGLNDFYTAAAAGTLPPVSYVEANFIAGSARTDEHPPADIELGQAFTAKVVDAVLHSPNWRTTALFITYDEHGGFYDHVPPPAACAPDALLPPSSDFRHFGMRVPLIVVSPFAKRGYVSHTQGDHTSLLRFVEARFGLPAMTARDANADPLFDLFDWDNPDYSIPELPSAPVDTVALAACQGDFTGPFDQ